MAALSEVVIFAEGQTEMAVKRVIKSFLDARCVEASQPRIALTGRRLSSEFLNETKLRRTIESTLRNGNARVVALMDVKSSGRPRQFASAVEVTEYLYRVFPDRSRFRAHAAQYDFEAWLLPYWADICRRVGVSRKSPGANPEEVNHEHPPSKHLELLYRLGGKVYNKPTEAQAILQKHGLVHSAAQCSQLRAFLNTFLEFAGCPLLS